jgi:hypothetical protein
MLSLPVARARWPPVCDAMLVGDEFRAPAVKRVTSTPAVASLLCETAMLAGCREGNGKLLSV